MRLTSFENCLKVLDYYSINPAGMNAIDVGGTEYVYLKPRFGYFKNPVRKNPLLKSFPQVVLLDKGYNIEQLGTQTDHQIDFLDSSSVDPLKDKFDIVFCFDTLEHTPDPVTFCDNLVKVAKPGGYIYISTLFNFIYHPSPGDFFRYTPEGLESCFKNKHSLFASQTQVVWSGWENDDIGVAILVQKAPFSISANAKPPLILAPALRPKKFLNKLFYKIREVLYWLEVKLTY